MAEPNLLAKRRLRVAQQAFRVADGLARSGLSDADRIAAVVQFDFAVETVLRAILFDAGDAKAKVNAFKELLNSVAAVLKERDLDSNVPSRGGIEQLRGIRNAAQHEARVPTAEEVIECKVHARDALVDLARLVWDVAFFKADVEAIRSKGVRDYLDRGFSAQAEGDLNSAMGWVRTALDYAYMYGGENLVGRKVNLDDIWVVNGFGNSTSLKGSDVETAMRRLQVLGRLSAFGMNVAEYHRWRYKLSKAPPLNIKGELMPPHGDPPEWATEDFDAALAYVVDSVLKMEQVVPNIDANTFYARDSDTLELG